LRIAENQTVENGQGYPPKAALNQFAVSL
jgi:hypothetical protein